MVTKNKKGIFRFKGLDNKEYKLTLQEKKFVELYLEYWGNGTEAAFEVYDIKREGKKGRNVAAAIAYENLRKPQIFAYVDIKLEEYGYNDESVKRQHLFVLNQMADLAAKNKAIDMYYRKKGEYAPQKIEHSGKIETEQKVRIDPALKKATKVYEEELKKQLRRGDNRQQHFSVDKKRRDKKRKR